MHRFHRSALLAAAGRGLAPACLAFGLAGCVFSPLQQPSPASRHAESASAAAKRPAPAPTHRQARTHHKAPGRRQREARSAPAHRSSPHTASAKPTVLLLASGDTHYAATVSALQSALGAHGFDVVRVAGRNLQWALYALGPKQHVYAVAVGDAAAAARARRLRVPTVYCEIAEPRAGRSRAQMHGVAALPPLRLQLTAWKRISPQLKRVALILGPGRERTAARAELAARAAHLTLTYRSVSSDQEAMYVFKRLAPQVDGLWLLPDTVLSPRAIKTMLSEAAQDKIQTLVFTPSLFRWGALLSVGSTAKNVAATVAGVLDRLAEEPQSVPATTPLSALELRVNEAAAASYGIHAPAASWIVRTEPGS